MSKKAKKVEQVEVIIDAKVLPSIEEMSEQGYKNKSAQIRYLDSLNFDRSSISKHLNIRYQHVRNVLITPLKRVVKEDNNEVAV